jgi:hypothetical protein
MNTGGSATGEVVGKRQKARVAIVRATAGELRGSTEKYSLEDMMARVQKCMLEG